MRRLQKAYSVGHTLTACALTSMVPSLESHPSSLTLSPSFTKHEGYPHFASALGLPSFHRLIRHDCPLFRVDVHHCVRARGDLGDRS
jgi:hypothetical protein